MLGVRELVEDKGWGHFVASLCVAVEGSAVAVGVCLGRGVLAERGVPWAALRLAG